MQHEERLCKTTFSSFEDKMKVKLQNRDTGTWRSDLAEYIWLFMRPVNVIRFLLESAVGEVPLGNYSPEFLINH